MIVIVFGKMVVFLECQKKKIVWDTKGKESFLCVV